MAEGSRVKPRSGLGHAESGEVPVGVVAYRLPLLAPGIERRVENRRARLVCHHRSRAQNTWVIEPARGSGEQQHLSPGDLRLIVRPCARAETPQFPSCRIEGVI